MQLFPNYNLFPKKPKLLQKFLPQKMLNLTTSQKENAKESTVPNINRIEYVYKFLINQFYTDIN